MIYTMIMILYIVYDLIPMSYDLFNTLYIICYIILNRSCDI